MASAGLTASRFLQPATTILRYHKSAMRNQDLVANKNPSHKSKGLLYKAMLYLLFCFSGTVDAFVFTQDWIGLTFTMGSPNQCIILRFIN